jgi:UDP-glucuronate 4-epimerase
MRILITGGAGMIGFHLAHRLVKENVNVVAVDNFNDYYDVALKNHRAQILSSHFGVNVIRGDFRETGLMATLVEDADLVVHLAAYANPRHALSDPYPYIQTNIEGTQRLIDLASRFGKPVLYASSYCVIHGQPIPGSENDRPAHQNNPYGWSKRVNECQFAHSSLPQSVGLRFFTVYGPFGRPDMATWSFTESILRNKPITVYGHGLMKRDFTFVEDIVEGVWICLQAIDKGEFKRQHEILNIGNGNQINLLDFIGYIEKCLGVSAIMNCVDMHPADVPETWANIDKISRYGYQPKTSAEDGVCKFVDWYLNDWIARRVA